MMHAQRNVARLIKAAVLLAPLAVAGCGGSGSGSGSGIGSGMQIAMHDSSGPWSQVMVTISEVDAVPANGPIAVINSTPQTFDLIALQNGINKIIGVDTTLPPGTYDQIRLKITSVVATDQAGVQHNVTVPSGAQTGLKLVGPFTVSSNTLTNVSLDFNADQSIVVTGGPSPKYLLKPVIKVDATVISGQVAGNVLDAGGNVIVPASGGTPPTIAAYPAGQSTDPTVPAVAATQASTTDGSYTLAPLPAGTYDIVYSATGFTSQTISNVTVTAGQTTTEPTVNLQ